MRSSLTASAGIDLEKPRPLQVSVGVRTSVTTGFLCIADIRWTDREKEITDLNWLYLMTACSRTKTSPHEVIIHETASKSELLLKFHVYTVILILFT